MVRRYVPAKTDCGVRYLKAVGRPTRAQEDELCRQMDGVVSFTSVDSRSQRNKGVDGDLKPTRRKQKKQGSSSNETVGLDQRE